MACVAANVGLVEVSSDGGTTWVRVADTVEFTANLTTDERECTSKDSNGVRMFHPDFSSYTLDASGHYDDFDAGQAILINAKFARTSFALRFRFQTAVGARLFVCTEAFSTSLTLGSPESGNTSVGGSIRLNNLAATAQTGVGGA